MDKKTQRTTGIRHQPLLVSRSPDPSPLEPGEFVEIFHQGQQIQARLQPTPLPNVQHVVALRHGHYPPEFPPVLPLSNTVSSHERMPTALDDSTQRQFVSQPAPIPDCDVYGAVDPYRPDIDDINETDHALQAPLPRFMNEWLKADAGRLDSYELPGLDSPSSTMLREVGAPPGKRAWPFAGNMSPVDLLDLHRSTVPKLQPLQLWQVPDPHEVRAHLMVSSSQRELTPKTPELPVSIQPLGKRATTCALSGDPIDLDLVAFVHAVKSLPLASRQVTLLDLGERKSYDGMVEFAKSLNRDQGAALWTQTRNWMTARNPLERNPVAAPPMALLVLFTLYTPAPIDLDELMNILPPTWPPALEHLRKDFLDRRAALVKERATGPRSLLLDRLKERYGNG